MPCRHLPDDAVFDNIVAAVRDHTHALLGLTITFSDEEWAAPSRLTGWTRSHVAAHLVANARGLSRVAEAHGRGVSEKMYDSDRDKMLEIERGALAAGLDQQISLDESAGALDAHWAQLAGDDSPVTLRAGYRIAVRHLPLARLFELVLHTFDLKPETILPEVREEVAPWVLQFGVDQIGDRPDMPAVNLIAADGYRARVGAPEQSAVDVSGPASQLLAWLTRNVVGPDLDGAFDLGPQS